MASLQVLKYNYKTASSEIIETGQESRKIQVILNITLILRGSCLDLFIPELAEL
jgi:hypothetical protein